MVVFFFFFGRTTGASETITTRAPATTGRRITGTKGLHLASCKRGQCLVNGPESLACVTCPAPTEFERFMNCESYIYNADSDNNIYIYIVVLLGN